MAEEPKEKKLLQWHPAFYAGLQIEFAEEAGKIIETFAPGETIRYNKSRRRNLLYRRWIFSDTIVADVGVVEGVEFLA